MSADVETLEALLARVERAEGADLDLAVDIFEAFEIASYIPDDIGDPTASIDAAVALVEKVLPGQPWQISASPSFRGLRGMPWARIGSSDQAFGRTPALALLAALLRALIARAKAEEAA